MVTKQATEKSSELAINIRRLEFLDKFLAKMAEDKICPSIEMIVMRRGVEIFNGVYGVASPGGPPMYPGMIADWQSVTKVVTATMVMMLQEDGCFTLHDKVINYFPEFNGPHKDEVELWHLMCHTSGMSEENCSEYQDDFLKKLLGDKYPNGHVSDEEYNSLINTARRGLGHTDEDIEKESAFDYLRRMSLGAPLRTAPRERFCYFGTGYWMLMKLCERMTGEDFNSLTRRRIFEPLGMVDSHMVLPEEKWDRVLLRDDAFRAGPWLNSERNRVSYGGSSGLKTTSRDMIRFGLMCKNNGTLDGVRILSPASVRAMTRDHNAEIPPEEWRRALLGSNWTLGWNIHEGKFDDLGILRSFSTYDHMGFGGARLCIDPENDLVFTMYMVETSDEFVDKVVLIAKAANILYSALD